MFIEKVRSRVGGMVWRGRLKQDEEGEMVVVVVFRDTSHTFLEIKLYYL